MDTLKAMWGWVVRMETNPKVTAVELAMLGIVLTDFLSYKAQSAPVLELQHVLSVVRPLLGI